MRYLVKRASKKSSSDKDDKAHDKYNRQLLILNWFWTEYGFQLGLASQLATDLYAKKKSSDVLTIKNKLQNITGDAISYSFTQQENLNNWLTKTLSKDYAKEQKEKNWHSVTHNEFRQSFEDQYEKGSKYQQDTSLLDAEQVTAFFTSRANIYNYVSQLLDDQ